MNYNFNEEIDRRPTESIKWNLYPEDVLPLWVADSDFACPPEVVSALKARVEHPIYGYGRDTQKLIAAFVDFIRRRHAWQIEPEWVVILPGVVTGTILAARTFNQPGKKLVIQPPVYPPFFDAAKTTDLVLRYAYLVNDGEGNYSIDFEIFENAIADNAGMFLLCNPHNPVGRVFTRKELQRMADICLKHHVPICSDEIHSDLIFSGHEHIPIAMLSDEIAQSSITLMAPSKTFNVAGLECALAIIPNQQLRERYVANELGIVPQSNFLGIIAAIAGYTQGEDWLEKQMEFLQGNRDYLLEFIRSHMSEIKVANPEGTYLAWLDCSLLNLEPTPFDFFLEHAKVGLMKGDHFGEPGKNFVRLNFACTRKTLEEALNRMEKVLKGRPSPR